MQTTPAKVYPDGTAERRQHPHRHVLADTFVVTARSGRQRLELLVRCPWSCGGWHQHRAPVGFESAVRAASCGRGRYVLHALAVEEAVA